MSSDNNSESGARKGFASRLLNKAIQERKTGEIKKPDLTTADAQKYAVETGQTRQPATTVKS